MHEQYFAGAAMDDIDDWTDVLGFPSEAEMWRQHSRLIEAELCCVQTELSKARRDLKQVADWYQRAADELAALKVAHLALEREKDRVYLDFVAMSNRANFSGHRHSQ